PTHRHARVATDHDRPGRREDTGVGLEAADACWIADDADPDAGDEQVRRLDVAVAGFEPRRREHHGGPTAPVIRRSGWRPAHEAVAVVTVAPRHPRTCVLFAR